MLILVACSATVPPQPAGITLPATKTLSTSVIVHSPVTAAPMHTPSLVSTLKPQATNGLTSSLVPPASTVVEALQIELGHFEHSLSERCVLQAVWSDDERLLYYAFSRNCASEPIQLAAYDVTTQLTQTAVSPFNYDSHIWQRLNVPEPKAGEFNPELEGHISPTGKYVIYPVGKPAGAGTPAMEGQTEIWAADSSGHQKIKLLTLGLSTACSAAWLKGETKVIFDVCYEGDGRDLRIADVQTGQVVQLEDVTDFKATALEYALSPDGLTLGVTNLNGTLWLVSLEDGRARIIDAKVATDLSWSKDGSTLYYRWGSSFETASAIHSYTIKTGEISTVVAETSLAQVNQRLLHGSFAVSPSGDKIALWDGRLWLLQLRQ